MYKLPVNKVTVQDSYPLPNIDELIDSVDQTRYLTEIDLQKGYYQIGLTDRAKTVSTFLTPCGLFQYNVTPFGMCNASATFQRAINYTIQGLQGVNSYLDDILIMSNDWYQHLSSIYSLFSRLAEAGFTINLAKSTFCKSRRYLSVSRRWSRHDATQATKHRNHPGVPHPHHSEVSNEIPGHGGILQKILQQLLDSSSPTDQPNKR